MLAFWNASDEDAFFLKGAWNDLLDGLIEGELLDETEEEAVMTEVLEDVKSFVDEMERDLPISKSFELNEPAFLRIRAATGR